MKKKMMVWLALGTFFLGIAGSAQADNLIVNGGFEAPALSLGAWNVFSSIPGWTKTSGHSIEIQNHAAGSPYEGQQLVELDSYANSAMQQVVASVMEGRTYTLSFAYSPRPGIRLGSNEIDVFWNGSLLAQIAKTGEGLRDTSWANYSFVVTGRQGSNILGFSAQGASDSLGGYLDDVRLSTNPVPEPATLLLFGIGVAGVATLQRRRQAS